jgi:hypothetical protein
MFDRRKSLRRQDPDQAAAREQRRGDRAERRAARKEVNFERSAAELDAEARHYTNLHHGNVGGANVGGGGS